MLVVLWYCGGLCCLVFLIFDFVITRLVGCWCFWLGLGFLIVVFGFGLDFVGCFCFWDLDVSCCGFGFGFGGLVGCCYVAVGCLRCYGHLKSVITRLWLVVCVFVIC